MGIIEPALGEEAKKALDNVAKTIDGIVASMQKGT